MRRVHKFAALAGLAGTIFACTVTGEAKAMIFPVACTVVGKVDPGLDTEVCIEILGTLSQTYPDVKFASGTATPGPSLEIIIHSATTSSLGLQIKWRSASGAVTEGDRLSLAIMDRKLDPGRRQSLYLRILTATPMPRQD